MKTMLVICGTGIATSTVVTGRIKEWLKENGYDKDVKMSQGKVSDELKNIENYDLTVSTTMVPDKYKDKVINGVPLLTGMGTEKVYEEIEMKLKELGYNKSCPSSDENKEVNLMMNDVVYLSLSELRHVIKNKELSPVELLESVISHITENDPDVSAYITYTFESAIEKAKEAERDILKGLYKGPLHGVPIGLKDIIHFNGTYTTSGSRLFAKRLSEGDADVVTRLDHSGAIIIGKENMHSLAYGSTGDVSHFGPIKNPLNSEKIAGGSSSGSAAGVSSYFGYGSIGSDTGGSIRIPAALCGVVGMKPTFDLISRVGVESLVPTLDTLGPITRTVEDNALLLEAIASRDSVNYASFTAKKYSSKVIGVPKGFYFEIIEPEIKSHFEEIVRNLLAAGYKVEYIEIPHMEAFNKANSIIFAAEVYESLKKEIDSQSDFIEEEIRLRILEGQRIKASEYTSMCKVKKQAIETFTTILKQVDVIMTPTVPAFPSDLNQRQIEIDEETYHIRSVYSRLVKASNLTGFPAMAVPSGKSREGYAHSVQLIGLPFQEKKLYNLASVIEQLS